MAIHVLTETLIEDLNDLGNLFTGLHWPSVETDANNYRANEIFLNLTADYKKVQEMETDLHDAVNELCLKCGQYREQHHGACDGCRWYALKKEWQE